MLAAVAYQVQTPVYDGPFDLLLKLYIPDGEDVGKYINDHLLDIDGIERTETTLTFKAF